MLIGLMSDTHNNRPGVRYALDIFRALEIKVILHAGDLISAELLEEFKGFSLFLSFGNGDDPFYISTKAGRLSDRFKYGEMLDLNLADKRIFMIHAIKGQSWKNGSQAAAMITSSMGTHTAFGMRKLEPRV